MKKNFVRLITILLGLSLFIALANVQAATLDRIVAVVNDAVITQNQLDQATDLFKQQMQQTGARMPAGGELRKQVLQHLIDTQLQLQVAKKEALTVDDASVNAAINHIAQQNNLTMQQLQDAVEKQGLSYNKYQQQIHDQMVISQLQQHEVAPRVVVTDQEIIDFMPALKKAKLTAPSAPATSGNSFYHLQDFLVALPDAATSQQASAALQQAQLVLTKMRAGGNIDQMNVLAADLGWRKVSELPDVFAQAVQGLPVGAIAGPVRAPNGYHLLKVLGMRGDNPNANPALPQAMLTHVRHILIKTTPLLTDDLARARLEKLRASILAGASFADVAAANSQDPGSASKGGDLGWVPPGVLDPAFEAEMNKLKPGQISGPFKSSFGWHIVQVLGRKDQVNDPVLLRQQARQIIYQRKYGEALENWLQQLRSQSYVKIM